MKKKSFNVNEEGMNEIINEEITTKEEAKEDNFDNLIQEDKIFLSPEHYYKWRVIIEEMHHYGTKKELLLAKHKMMEMTIDIQKLNFQIFKEKIKNCESSFEDKKLEYNKYKETLEEIYKQSLNDCTIMDDFSIKKLTNSKQSES